MPRVFLLLWEWKFCKLGCRFYQYIARESQATDIILYKMLVIKNPPQNQPLRFHCQKQNKLRKQVRVYFYRDRFLDINVTTEYILWFMDIICCCLHHWDASLIVLDRHQGPAIWNILFTWFRLEVYSYTKRWVWEGEGRSIRHSCRRCPAWRITVSNHLWNLTFKLHFKSTF